MDDQTGLVKPVIRKLGTIDCDIVETTPVVFKGRLYRLEYIRYPRYWANDTGDTYFRFVDVETGERLPAFAAGWHFGSAFVDGDFVYVTGVSEWGGRTLQEFRSSDLRT